jgi:LysR family transcriptional regulator, carnitine catabolism transcriptional activator
MPNANSSGSQKRAGLIPDVSARQLDAAIAVAEYRSFIAAAAYLGISQPALTLTIKRIEKTLGVTLFLRSTRHVTITAAGREFIAMAERVLNDLKLSAKSLGEIAEQRRGQVIVTSLIPIEMSSVIAEYGRRFPGIEIQLREGFQEDVKDDVRSGLADFGIGYLGDLPASHLMESLGVEVLSVVARNDHPIARMRQIEFKALRDVALVSLPVDSVTRRMIDATATAAGFALRHAVTTGRPITLMNLVAHGIGVAVVPASPWPRAVHPNLVWRPLVRPRLSAEFGIMRLRDRELSPPAANLLALARERLRKVSR